MSIAPTELTEFFEQLDFDSQLPCEGAGHKAGSDGHNPSQRGAIFMRIPCGHGIVLCIDRIIRLEIFDEIKCERCNTYYPRHEVQLTFIPRDRRKQ